MEARAIVDAAKLLVDAYRAGGLVPALVVGFVRDLATIPGHWCGLNGACPRAGY